MCVTCNDRGFVFVQQTKDGMQYDQGYKCYCEAGTKRGLSWPIIPFEMAPERPLGDEVKDYQTELPEEWRDKP